MILTSNPAETGAGLEEATCSMQKKSISVSGRGKNLVDLLGTSYDGFKYSDWVAEFNLTVSKMLSQGLQCLGLFTFCESEQVRRLATRKLDSLLKKMH